MSATRKRLTAAEAILRLWLHAYERDDMEAMEAARNRSVRLLARVRDLGIGEVRWSVGGQ